MFCHRYPTGACVAGDGYVRSLRDNVSSSHKDGSPIVRSGCDSQHREGRGLGLCGMANSGEVLINVVSDDKRKMLSRLDQKVSGQERVLVTHPSQIWHQRL